MIESDNSYGNMIEQVWNLDNKDNYEMQPFAGTKNKVMVVDPKQQYLKDNYRGAYG